MTAIDPVYAQWLMADGLWQVQADATLTLRWGIKALTTERMTTIATKADAVAEATRQLAFLGPVAAIDEHLLVGRWEHLRGQVITLTIDRLGYEAGADVFLLGAEDNEATGLSKVTVLKRL